MASPFYSMCAEKSSIFNFASKKEGKLEFSGFGGLRSCGRMLFTVAVQGPGMVAPR